MLHFSSKTNGEHPGPGSHTLAKLQGQELCHTEVSPITRFQADLVEGLVGLPARHSDPHFCLVVFLESLSLRAGNVQLPSGSSPSSTPHRDRHLHWLTWQRANAREHLHLVGTTLSLTHQGHALLWAMEGFVPWLNWIKLGRGCFCRAVAPS